MQRRAAPCSLVAVLFGFVAVAAVLAQTSSEPNASTSEGRQEGKKSVGGDEKASDEKKGDKEKEAEPANPWYTAHGQATVVMQGHGLFRSPYEGSHSQLSAVEQRVTSTATLYFAAKLWEGGLLVINPEVSGGRGVGDTMGIAGFPNGEATRVGNPQPTPYFARFLLQQTFELGGEWEKLDDAPNQLPGPRYKNNVVLKLGKMPATDDFDDNRYSHDPRTQFLNWALMYNGAWDYPANTRGYTYGFTAELNVLDWSIRYGVFGEPKEANGADIDPRFVRANAQIVEFEQRYTWGNRPGAVRALAFLNNANMGLYRQALLLMPVGPDVTQTRAYRSKPGFGVNWEQEILKDELGVFGRLGWADSRTEAWAFTEIDRTVSLGLSLQGKRWDRPKDTVGLAGAINGLGAPHRDYLAAGGLGFILGDGRLNYGPEMILETYYNWRMRKGVNLMLDLQGIDNPGYNRDRGPLFVVAVRAHFEY